MTDDARGVAAPDRTSLAALSLCAAAIHFAMVPAHAAESLAHGVGFAVAAWAQVLVAVAVLLRPSPRALGAGIVTQVVLVAAWGVSRTAGLPFGPNAWEAEAVGSADLLAVGLEGGFVLVAALALLARPATARKVPVLAGIGAALLAIGGTTAAIATPSLTAHGHGDGGEHRALDVADDHVDDLEVHEAHGVAEVEVEEADAEPADDGGHGHGDGFGQHGHKLVNADGPPSAEQIDRAAALIRDTKASIVPRWSDPADAERDGFVAIQGPQARFVHYINLGWIFGDDRVLDPEFPESLVYRSTNGTVEGYELGSAMYILPGVGHPIPDVGGSLTPWHDHGELCFGAGARIVGVTDGTTPCPEGSSNVQTPDMLHVWVVPHDDGPFGGID